MKTELEKIKELKEKFEKTKLRFKDDFFKDADRMEVVVIKAKAKAIREKAENGCVADWDENGYECFPDSLCPTCQEIIKIAKEIEK